ncbi:hypothetical protein ACIBBD_23180 [Streptomyces sp. NPDC051315]|uniref:hypothetical protein n=1 Tax=Streptomyces sp. NPDC051315 TaxID=3365650 RepID=UPI0037A7A9DD
MTDAGRRRRRLWRWAVVVWLVTATAGGGLTLWLQDAAEPPEPRGGQESGAPAPLLGVEVGEEHACPPPQEEDTVVDCLFVESR